jgi:hypothetical protein
MKIKRRINKGTKEIIEDVELVKRNANSAMVKLKNGDIIKRKNRDIVGV